MAAVADNIPADANKMDSKPKPESEFSVQKLVDMFTKLNPSAKEFFPSSYSQNHDHRLQGYNQLIPTNFLVNTKPSPDDTYPNNRRRRNSFNQGRRRLNGRSLKAQREDSVRRTVYVSDIDQHVTEERLAALFSSCGQVIDCRICGDPHSVLRFAFVEFADDYGARAALNLGGTVLGYYPVRVLPSKTEREKNTHTHSQTQIVGTEKQIKISMDHSLRCFGKTIPKTHNHFLLFSLSLFLFFFSFFANAAFDLATIPFNDGYSPLFGHGNVVRSSDGNGVQLLLDRYTGSGFISSNMYQYGFFSANIKLPSNYTAGICVAFYTSNGDVFEKTHDELDFEFLGNIAGKPWRFQTNLYGNGSTQRGREERYRLWFDPTKEYHRYSILWTAKNVVFYIDEVPIREVLRSEEMGGDYPSKPMSLYATIWDASNWATSGGRYKVNYKYAPFVTQFKDLVLKGCSVDPIQEVVSTQEVCSDQHTDLEAQDYAAVTPLRRLAMRRFRQRYMYYSYCYDTLRYPAPPPECNIIPQEKQRFKETGRLKFGGAHRRRSRRGGRTSIPVDDTDQGVM